MRDDLPTIGSLLLGTFLLICGACILLVGGGCTYFLGDFIWSAGADPAGVGLGLFLVLLSLATVAAGIVAIRAGLHLLRGGG